MSLQQRTLDFVSDQVLAVGGATVHCWAVEPAASALPLTRQGPCELDEIDTELKGVTDRIVAMIGELSQ